MSVFLAWEETGGQEADQLHCGIRKGGAGTAGNGDNRWGRSNAAETYKEQYHSQGVRSKCAGVVRNPSKVKDTGYKRKVPSLLIYFFISVSL